MNNLTQPSHFWVAFQLTHALQRLRDSIKAYNPEQPREPAGSPEGGRWASEEGSDDERINLAGGFKNEDLNMTVQDFISKMCKGSINAELPSEFLNYSLKELLAARRAGVANSDTCYKLLHREKYRK
jgi:hypothetical protein